MSQQIKQGGKRIKEGVPTQAAKDRPVITVITVVYNGEEYLEETIKSVIEQTYDNIEYLIIDGGSVDGTLEIIKRYEDKIDYWISEPDQGVYDALNKGIKLSTGQIIAALHADDLYCNNNVLEKVILKFVDNDNLSWLFGNICVLDQNIRLEHVYKVPKFDWNLLLFNNYCYVPHPATFIKRSVIEQIGYFDTRYKLAADYDLFLRIGSKYKCGKIELPITKFRFHKNRLSEKLQARTHSERIKIQRQYPSINKIYLRLFYMNENR